MVKDYTEIIIENKIYSKLDEDIYYLLHKIEKLIPREQVHLLETLETMYNRQECIAGELSYKQGLKVGKTLVS